MPRTTPSTHTHTFTQCLQLPRLLRAQDLAAAISASQTLLQQALQAEAKGSAAEREQESGQCGWPGADAKGADAAACKGEGQQVPVLVSGAGHDAMAMAEVTKVGCKRGREGVSRMGVALLCCLR